MQFEWKLDLNIVVGAFALFATCVFFYMQSRREQRGLQREIYQRLELASIEIFRFEADHLDILQSLNSAEHRCSKDSQEYKALIAYVTQVLNLFEMAVRFREQKIMPNDVFGSWVIWFYDLCAADNFPYVWEDLKFNYLPDLREMMNTGVSLVAEDRASASNTSQQRFFDCIATRLGDPSIRTWLKV
jgi:hypothetical protein